MLFSLLIFLLRKSIVREMGSLAKNLVTFRINFSTRFHFEN